MELKQFNMPFFMKIEEKAILNLRKYLHDNESKNKNIILGIDPYINNLYGETIYKQLTKIYKSVKLIEIKDNTLNQCFEISSYIINNSYDIVIGVGGGKTLDVCKYSAYISKKIYISMPTAISHDGIASPIAVLKCEKDIKSLGCNIPSGIIVDLEVIKNSPKELIKAGIGDTLSNYTAIKDWQLANKRGMCEIDDFAVLISDLSVKSVLNYENKDIDNVEFLKLIVESCIMSGIAMNLAGNSRPGSGSEHLISHAMDKLQKNIPHGIQVGVSSIISNYLHGEDPNTIIKFLKIFGLPTTLKELNITYEDYIYIMQNAQSTRPDRYTILDETNLDITNLKMIYENCFK